jgi:3-oxoacyl-[acyl-carrier-protein] synthase-3
LKFARFVTSEMHLPEGRLSNLQLNELFPDWGAEKIGVKTGIQTRAVASKDEFSSSLGVQAAKKLLKSNSLDVGIFDYLICISQTPDFLFPGIATTVHEAIGMRRDSGAVDLNIGCSGYVYGLGLAQGLIATNQASNVLIVTSDTYSKLLNTDDRSVRTIFGDGASATWIDNLGDSDSIIGLNHGVDGSGAGNLIVPNGGLRDGTSIFPKSNPESRGLKGSAFDLYMNGPAIFDFTLKVAGESVQKTLNNASLSRQDIDYFVFHQANAFILRHLGEKLNIPESKLPILMESWGNTVSGTIPMALTELSKSGKLNPGSKVLLFGFGVGLSWASVVISIP